MGNCPLSLSAIPITAHSATLGCSANTSSIAPVETTMEPSETVTEEAAKMAEEIPVAEAAEEKKETKE